MKGIESHDMLVSIYFANITNIIHFQTNTRQNHD